METVSELETQIVGALNQATGLLPDGLEIVSAEVLNGGDRKSARKKKGNANIANLKAGDSIYLQVGTSGASATQRRQPVSGAPAEDVDSNAEDLLRALDRAERVPGHSFVALKWFRDAFLPQEDLAWAKAPDLRHKALSLAISRSWILRDRLANPKNPQFPTTALRVNRSHSEARRILGQAKTLGWDFTPIEARGEPASVTLMRERGRY